MDMEWWGVGLFSYGMVGVGWFRGAKIDACKWLIIIARTPFFYRMVDPSRFQGCFFSDGRFFIFKKSWLSFLQKLFGAISNKSEFVRRMLCSANFENFETYTFRATR